MMVVSADLPIVFFYFASSFMGMFSLLKRYANAFQNKNEDSAFKPTAKLNIKEMGSLIINRWFRLAFPTYILMLFALFVFPYIGEGPVYNFMNSYYL